VVPISTGGTQSLSLFVGAAHAGKLYFLIGSASGTAPGIVLDSQLLPLNIDTYTLLTAANPNQPPLGNSLGLLDGNGAASMTFSLPAGAVSPAAVGLVLHHAVAVLSPATSVDLASNAVSIELIP